MLVGAITPGLLKSEWNPNGAPIEAWNAIRTGLTTDRAHFYRELAAPFYGANRAGARVSQSVLDQFWRLSMQAGLKAHPLQAGRMMVNFISRRVRKPSCASAFHTGRSSG